LPSLHLFKALDSSLGSSSSSFHRLLSSLSSLFRSSFLFFFLEPSLWLLRFVLTRFVSSLSSLWLFCSLLVPSLLLFPVFVLVALPLGPYNVRFPFVLPHLLSSTILSSPWCLLGFLHSSLVALLLRPFQPLLFPLCLKLISLLFPSFPPPYSLYCPFIFLPPSILLFPPSLRPLHLCFFCSSFFFSEPRVFFLQFFFFSIGFARAEKLKLFFFQSRGYLIPIFFWASVL
jgi:hypothetical protein